MSTIDRQRIDAVALLGEVGYRWTGTAWELPHAGDLPAERRLSTIDLADIMLDTLIDMMPNGTDDEARAARIMWLHEAWEGQTGFASRRLPRSGSALSGVDGRHE